MDLQESSDGSKTPCGTDQKSIHDLLKSQRKQESTKKLASQRKKHGQKQFLLSMEARIPQIFFRSPSNALTWMGTKTKKITNGTQNEVLIQMIKTIIVLCNHYDWKESRKESYITKTLDMH